MINDLYAILFSPVRQTDVLCSWNLAWHPRRTKAVTKMRKNSPATTWSWLLIDANAFDFLRLSFPFYISTNHLSSCDYSRGVNALHSDSIIIFQWFWSKNCQCRSFHQNEYKNLPPFSLSIFKKYCALFIILENFHFSSLSNGFSDVFYGFFRKIPFSQHFEYFTLFGVNQTSECSSSRLTTYNEYVLHFSSFIEILCSIKSKKDTQLKRHTKLSAWGKLLTADTKPLRKERELLSVSH